MKFRCLFLLAIICLISNAFSNTQDDPKPENATAAVLRAFETHDIVIIGEIHSNKQEYEWFRSLVSTSEFADKVDDLVLEMGNSLYQQSVDRYVRGESVPLEQVQRAWRNMVGSVGPQSPVVEWLYQAVRETNMKRRGKRQMRIICGDPNIDWDKVQTWKDMSPYLSRRDDWYAQVVKDEVLAKHHHALLIMGALHFLRNFSIGPMKATIEPELRQAGARTYFIMAGTNTPGGYDVVDHRFDSWSAPVIAAATGWLGELPARALLNGGVENITINMTDASGARITAPPLTVPKLKDGADAFLYLGPHDTLTSVSMTRRELKGTRYLKELERRSKIQEAPLDPLPEKQDEPQFPRPTPNPD